MKVLKVMSIIGIIWFSLSLIFIVYLNKIGNVQASLGWGILGMLYAIPYSIVGLNMSARKNKSANVLQDLLRLHELKDKSVFTEDEYQEWKAKLLKK